MVWRRTATRFSRGLRFLRPPRLAEPSRRKIRCEEERELAGPLSFALLSSTSAAALAVAVRSANEENEGSCQFGASRGLRARDARTREKSSRERGAPCRPMSAFGAELLNCTCGNAAFGKPFAPQYNTTNSNASTSSKGTCARVNELAAACMHICCFEWSTGCISQSNHQLPPSCAICSPSRVSIRHIASSIVLKSTECQTPQPTRCIRMYEYAPSLPH